MDMVSRLRSTNTHNMSVRFGEAVDRGRGDNKIFPFWQAFVNRSDDTYLDGTSATLASMGITIPALSQRQHIMKLYPDYPFNLIFIHYDCYFDNAGSIEWYNNEAGFFLEPGDFQTAIGTPLTRFITISAIAKGSDGRYLYGGTNMNIAVNGGGAELRIPPSVMQGYDYGAGNLNTPYLLPADGAIELRISNNHATKDLVVTGSAFGYKVRI